MDSESDRRRLSAAKEALQRELSKAQLEVRVPETSLLMYRPIALMCGGPICFTLPISDPSHWCPYLT
jgi:hypothetical protein